MSDILAASAAIAGVPGWDPRELDIRVLHGGMTNRTFLVRRGNDRYVLRIAPEPPPAYLPDRRSSLATQRAAAAAGLAPDIIHADPAQGVLLCRYAPGPVWSAADLQINDNVESLAALLRRVHALPPARERYDAPAAASAYAKALRGHEDLGRIAWHCEQLVRDSTSADEPCTCHNDIVAQNVVATPQLVLLDWEYAGLNDPLFDLASPICYHDLPERPALALLSAYAGGAGGELRDRLGAQLRRFDAIQWLWLAHRDAETHADRLALLRERLAL
ncbi:MAG: phosphotransferase [Woeseiaceae bacterium]